MTAPIATGLRVGVLDPVDVTRQALVEALAGALGVATVDGAAAPVDAVDGTQDVVVVVSQSHDGSLEDVRAVRGAHPTARILLIGRTADRELLSDAIAAGVDGYLTDRDSVDDLHRAVRLIADGAAVIPPHMLGHLLRDLVRRNDKAAEAARLFSLLTPREREVLSSLVEGRDHVAIATELVISPETAKTHIQNVITKLGVHSRLAAATLAVEYGLVRR